MRGGQAPKEEEIAAGRLLHQALAARRRRTTSLACLVSKHTAAINSLAQQKLQVAPSANYCRFPLVLRRVRVLLKQAGTSEEAL